MGSVQYVLHESRQQKGPEKKFRMSEREFQKSLVELSKSRDLNGLIDAMGRLLESSYHGTDVLQSAKAAINLSATVITAVEPNHDELTRYNSCVLALMDRFSSLGDLENVVFAVIKIKLLLGDVKTAVKCALECKEPRSRLFSLILEDCSSQNNFDLAEKLLGDIYARGLVPTEQDFANAIHTLSDLSRAEFAPRLNRILERLAGSYDILESSCTVDALSFILENHAFMRDQLIVSDRTSADNGKCPMSGLNLRLLDLSDGEIDEMLDLTLRLSKEASMLKPSNECVDDFESIIEKFISSDTLPNLILDAANIAHTNQNYEGGYFRFDQVDDILSEFKNMGKRCLVVIHEKWTNPKRDLILFPPNRKSGKKARKIALPQLGETLVEGRPVVFQEPQVHAEDESREILQPVPMEIIDRWRANNEVLIVPHGQNDDWFWMHICLVAMKRNRAEEILLVSNDQMRDHFWRMKNPKFFTKFRSNHVCQYSIQFGEDKINRYSFKLPSTFSVSIQHQLVEQGQNIWHLPVGKSPENVKWFIFRLDS